MEQKFELHICVFRKELKNLHQKFDKLDNLIETSHGTADELYRKLSPIGHMICDLNAIVREEYRMINQIFVTINGPEDTRLMRIHHSKVWIQEKLIEVNAEFFGVIGRLENLDKIFKKLDIDRLWEKINRQQ